MEVPTIDPGIFVDNNVNAVEVKDNNSDDDSDKDSESKYKDKTPKKKIRSLFQKRNKKSEMEKLDEKKTELL